MVNIIGIDTYKTPALLDIWCFTHFIWGIVFYIFLNKILKLSLVESFIVWNLIHLLYEMKDYYFTYIKEYTIRPTYEADFFRLGYHSNNTWQNSICDLIIGILGFGFGYLLLRKS